MAVWLILTTLQALWFDKLNRGHLAHLALAITVLGASQLAGHSHERGALLSIGQSVSVGQYELRLDAITPELGPNFTAERYHLTALQNGKVLGNLYPERRHYSVRAMQMNETGILPLGSGDLYAVPGEKRAQQIALRVAHKPGSRWLWLGGILLTIAGLLPCVVVKQPTNAMRRPYVRNKTLASATGRRSVFTVTAMGALPCEFTSDQADLNRHSTPLTLTTLNGESLTTDTLLEQPFLLNVWASWCTNCRKEHALLQTLSGQLPIIGLNYRDTPDAAKDGYTA